MFESVKMDDKQTWNVTLVKDKAEVLANLIEKTCYDEDCKKIAITNLAQCVMWATKGISRSKYEE